MNLQKQFMVANICFIIMLVTSLAVVSSGVWWRISGPSPFWDQGTPEENGPMAILCVLGFCIFGCSMLLHESIKWWPWFGWLRIVVRIRRVWRLI